MGCQPLWNSVLECKILRNDVIVLDGKILIFRLYINLFIEGSLEMYGWDKSETFIIFQKFRKFGDLGPNFHIWAFGAQNTKIAIIWVWNMIGWWLRASWKHIDNAILIFFKKSKNSKNLGDWGRISIFGHLGPKTQK